MIFIGFLFLEPRPTNFGPLVYYKIQTFTNMQWPFGTYIRTHSELERNGVKFYQQGMNFSTATNIKKALIRFTDRLHTWVSEGHTAVILISSPLSFSYTGVSNEVFRLSETKLLEGSREF